MKQLRIWWLRRRIVRLWRQHDAMHPVGEYSYGSLKLLGHIEALERDLRDLEMGVTRCECCGEVH